jgi:predicted PurR-regulated permease PerM
MTPKKQSKTFTSIRIIGKKAQNIISRAKGDSEEGKKKKTPLPKTKPRNDILAHISISSIVYGAFAILAIVAGAWLFFHLRQKIILLFIALFVAIVLDPGVQTMERFGIPRGVSILIHYVLAILVFLFLLVKLIPIIAIQLQQIAVFTSMMVNDFLADPQVSLPLLSDDVNHRLTVLTQVTLQNLSIDHFTDALQTLSQKLSSAAQGSVRFAAQLAGSVAHFFVSFVVVLVLAFFMQIEKEKNILWVRSFLSSKYRAYADSKSEAIHSKIGQWARGQLLLMLSIATLTFLALIILRMPYALTLAVLAGFCELIPVVGPLFAAIPAVLIAMTQNGFMWALVIAGVYYVIQWCENNLLVPLIMKRAVGLSPIAILFAMMVGISFPNTIHPILGVILAIPTTTILTLFLEDWRTMRGQSKD